MDVYTNAVSNPLYCASETESNPNTDNTDNLDHLWHAPRTSDSVPEHSQLNDHGLSAHPLGYDIPRPLIEANTIEQKLKYQNDLTMPMCVRNLDTKRVSIPHAATIDLSHYDSPVKRRKSYMDMSGGNGNCGYNLDTHNVDKKKLSKDITFRFSSLLNLNEQTTSLM